MENGGEQGEQEEEEEEEEQEEQEEQEETWRILYWTSMEVEEQKQK